MKNGTNLPIKGTPWLPDVTDPYVHSNSEAFDNQNVSSLMVQGDRQQDVDLIKDLFNERDMHLILSIPLNADIEDNWYWRHERLGIYTVKSAHLVLQKIKRNSQENNSGFWRKLWNLKIPPRSKILNGELFRIVCLLKTSFA